MILQYDELKDAIKEDFERFYQWGFNEKQIYPAVLNEYKYGVDFSQIENICIHIFLIMSYKERKMNYYFILIEIERLILFVGHDKIKTDLEKEYDKFINDLRVCGRCRYNNIAPDI